MLKWVNYTFYWYIALFLYFFLFYHLVGEWETEPCTTSMVCIHRWGAGNQSYLLLAVAELEICWWRQHTNIERERTERKKKKKSWKHDVQQHMVLLELKDNRGKTLCHAVQINFTYQYSKYWCQVWVTVAHRSKQLIDSAHQKEYVGRKI